MNQKTNLPRPEHPQPQFFRESWINLNGEWEFETDRAVSGWERGLQNADGLSGKINVPFCMESKLSGVGDTDFCNCVWYRREVEVPAEFTADRRRVLLHIGASDYRTTVYVNGVEVGTHIGGYTSFSFDITKALRDGKNNVVIRAEDDLRSHKQAGGKQSSRYASYACSYTRTTGIWQTVWLESVPEYRIRSYRAYPNPAEKNVTLEVRTDPLAGGRVTVCASYHGKKMGEASALSEDGCCTLTVPLKEAHLWEIGKGELYDLELAFDRDCVRSYFGLRSVSARNGVLYLNGKKVFQRLVLDQGFYPDGIYTAPSDKELENDIHRSMAMGFHGARLHQKIFEARFLYHADRLGYIVWGEHANWELDISRDSAWRFLPEWTESVERDFNHPSIIGWCPLNETEKDQDEDFVRYVVNLTHTLDRTRPVIDTSGYIHIAGLSDFEDWHDYEQDPEVLKKTYLDVAAGIPIRHPMAPYPLFPTFISEYGGIKWDVGSNLKNAWGYGGAPQTEEEFKERFRGLTEALMSNPFISGLCYTQLTDVEQEVNGLYSYDRHAKFDPAFFHEVLSRKAAIED